MANPPQKRYSLELTVMFPEDPNFDKSNYTLRNVYNDKNGFMFFSYTHKDGEHFLFDMYKDPNIELEKIDFKKEFEKLREQHRSSFESQRLKKWYKLATIRAFYEAIKFMGYEHEWPEISKMVPDVFHIPKEKFDRYCDKGTLVAYQSLFGELWSDKPYPSPFLVGAEMAHIPKHYMNKGRTVKLNSLQKEHEERAEQMIKLHLMKQMGYDLKRTSLSDKKIENMQTVMRLWSQDPHAGYYEADLELLEKIEKMSPGEKKEALSYEGYKKWIVKNAKTKKKRFFTALNMLNVMVKTPINDHDELRENIGIIRDLIIPKRG